MPKIDNVSCPPFFVPARHWLAILVLIEYKWPWNKINKSSSLCSSAVYIPCALTKVKILKVEFAYILLISPAQDLSQSIPSTTGIP